MEEVYILKSEMNSWIKKHFDKDIISINDLLVLIEDLDSELEHVKEEFEDYKQNIQDNYKQITPSEMGWE